MELKVVVSNTTGKSYQINLKEDKTKILKGKKIGDEVDGALLGLSGYKLVVTGGSDKSGFPMRKGIHGAGRIKSLMEGGVGYKPKRDERKRKRIHGEMIGESIVQVNMKVSSSGKKSIEELLGIKEEKPSEETPKEESQPVVGEEPKKEEKKRASKKELEGGKTKVSETPPEKEKTGGS